jgi:hypothetical protein
MRNRFNWDAITIFLGLALFWFTFFYFISSCNTIKRTKPCNQCPQYSEETNITIQPTVEPPLVIPCDTLIVDPISEPSDQLVHAMINVESLGNDSAFCASEKAVGCLQIRPIMLREVNRLLRRSGSNKRFSLTDRWSRVKSIEIFDTWRSISHPNDSEEVVARCWNGGPRGWKKKATDRYWEKVTAYLYENEKS